MPRLKKVPCAHCDAKLVGGVSFCTNCEQPTIWASHEERTEWELHQWSQKRSSRPKRRVSVEVAEVTPIQSRRTAGPTKPIVKHPAAQAVAQAVPIVSPPKARPRATKPAAEQVTPPAAPEKKQVAKAKPEPERAPARKASRKPVTSKAPAAKAAPAAEVPPAAPPAPIVVEQATTEIATAAPAMPDHAAEQTALLRELLQHVISIEEKINGNGSRRLRLLKRSG